MSICVRYTRSDEKAREVLNLGFHKVLKNLSKYRHGEVPFKSWLRRVMINTLINEFRKEKAHYENMLYVESYTDSNTQSDINEAAMRLEAEQIHYLISRLPEVNRQVFNLFYIDGYKHREIADLLNINENTSKWYLTVAKNKLRAMIVKSELLTEKIKG